MQNFFIVGAQKAGTTALHSYLSLHPELALSKKKELHFFDDETIDWARPDYKKLEAGMDREALKIRGEATPIYMYWPNSIERLHAYDAKAKLIVLLRHPVFRAHSHWRMEVKRCLDNYSFSDAIRSGRQRVKDAENGAHRVYSYVERGFYAHQIRHILSFFERSNVHFATTDQLWLEPKSTLGAIEIFLGAQQKLNPKSEYIISARTDISERILDDDYEYLMEIYRSDMQETAEITGLRLDSWRSGSYQEPVKF
jgi:hypothetical protein